MLTIPPRSDQSRSVWPPPPPNPFFFFFAGGVFFFGRGDGARSGFLKEERVEFKIQIQNRAFVHHIIVSSLKGIPPRHPPREFPLGLRAPVLGMVTAQILGNEPFPFLVGERILLSPVRCLGSCSLREHSAERNRAHPTRPHKPLSGFSYPSLWCRFRF